MVTAARISSDAACKPRRLAPQASRWPRSMARSEPPRRRRMLAHLRPRLAPDPTDTLRAGLPRPATQLGRHMKTVLLLVISNTFMTLAWYGPLKFKDKPLWLMILASWGIAFFEYLFQVPANRIGSYQFTVTQLKVMQECITFVVFTVIAWFLFGAALTWNIIVSYALIVTAVFFAFKF